MRQSHLFTKTTRKDPKDEISTNARLLIRAGFINKLSAGVYSFLPLGWRGMKKIENIIREEMEAIDGQEIFMPTLQPKENWEKTGRWDSMDDLYKVRDKSDREFALGPTHEEVIVPLVRNYISSHKDIPFYAYQVQNKFRMELRSKSGLLRGREFLMKDLYSFHLDEKDLNNYYEKAKAAYFKIFKRAGLGDKTYLTFASGGSFSKCSHEFQTVCEAGEDMIYICTKCKLAINKEIKEENKECPGCKSTAFSENKSIEVGNIFKLMTKYSAPFDLKVKDESGKDVILIMGCYGIGLNRLMGTIVELNHDEKGIIWPESVAPFAVHLLNIKNQKSNIKINEESERVYKILQNKKIEVLFDDRDISAGEKFADADLTGCPQRLLISDKTVARGILEIKNRSAKQAKEMKINEVVKFLEK